MHNQHYHGGGYYGTPDKRPELTIPTHHPSLHELHFTPYAYAKMQYIRDIGRTEVGFYGISAEQNLLTIEDVVMLKQECTAASVDFDDTSGAEFLEKYALDLKMPVDRFNRIWIHTHPGDSPNPSGTDEDTFKKIFGRCPWSIMYILARGGQDYCRLQYNVGPTIHLRLETRIQFAGPSKAVDQAAVEAWFDEYKSNVNLPRYQQSTYTPTRTQGYTPTYPGTQAGISRHDDDQYDHAPDYRKTAGGIYVVDSPRVLLNAPSTPTLQESKAESMVPAELKTQDADADTDTNIKPPSLDGCPNPTYETRPEILLATKARIDRVVRIEELVAKYRREGELTQAEQDEHTKLVNEEENASWLESKIGAKGMEVYGS